MLRMGEIHLAEVSAHVTSRYPDEACGLLIGNASGDRREVRRVVAAKNLNRERSRDRYEMDPSDFRRADVDAARAGAEVVGIYHSHPDHPCLPSAFDQERAWEGYSYLILSVSARGLDEFRSWILRDGTFRDEGIEIPAHNKQNEVKGQ